ETREIAGTHGGCGDDGARGIGSAANACAFIGAEEERLVLDDRPAEGGAVLVPLERGDDGGEKVAGVHCVIPQELIGRTVEMVRAGSRGELNDSARAGFAGAVV